MLFYSPICYQINGSLARRAIKDLMARGSIRMISAHASQQIYTRATNTQMRITLSSLHGQIDCFCSVSGNQCLEPFWYFVPEILFLMLFDILDDRQKFFMLVKSINGFFFYPFRLQLKMLKQRLFGEKYSIFTLLPIIPYVAIVLVTFRPSQCSIMIFWLFDICFAHLVVRYKLPCTVLRTKQVIDHQAISIITSYNIRNLIFEPQHQSQCHVLLIY